MSWSDPCSECDKHKADCDCKEGYSVTIDHFKQQENIHTKLK